MIVRMLVSGKIFRSRWSALFWAAGIIWTAYDFAEANTPATPPPHIADQANAGANATNATDDDAAGMAILANLVSGS